LKKREREQKHATIHGSGRGEMKEGAEAEVVEVVESYKAKKQTNNYAKRNREVSVVKAIDCTPNFHHHSPSPAQHYRTPNHYDTTFTNHQSNPSTNPTHQSHYLANGGSSASWLASCVTVSELTLSSGVWWPSRPRVKLPAQPIEEYEDDEKAGGMVAVVECVVFSKCHYVSRQAYQQCFKQSSVFEI
jgi:hypothetical protein